MLKFGLQKTDIEIICGALSRYPQIKKAIIFGSRAKNIFRNGSDIDISIKCDQSTNTVATEVEFFLNEEIWLPYKFDIIDYFHIKNQALKSHIDRVGITLYEK